MSARELSRRAGATETAFMHVVATARKNGERIPGEVPGRGYTEDALRWYLARRKPAKLRYVDVPPIEDRPAIVGLTPGNRRTSSADLWERAIAHQRRDSIKTEIRHSQSIDIPGDLPALVVCLSDLHFGNAHTDYALALHHAELIRDTPRCYGIVAGDIVDNWVASAELAYIQAEQVMRLSDEMDMAESWLKLMHGKLLVAVSGNHEARTTKAAGIDLLARLLGDAQVLYDAHDVRFTLRLAGASWRFAVRHSWPGKSKMNPTYGQEVGFRDIDASWDIAIGGHTHTPAPLAREFWDGRYDRRRKLAVQLGAYEYDGAYGRELGLQRNGECGSLGLMLFPSGAVQVWHDLDEAARYLTYLCAQAQERPRARAKR